MSKIKRASKREGKQNKTEMKGRGEREIDRERVLQEPMAGCVAC